MISRIRWSRFLIVIGSIAMLVGVIDPMEGSLVILLGSGLIVLGTFLQRSTRSELLYWLSVFILIAVGVGALFGLSAVGGFGGRTGRSMWWGLTILPYIIGWIIGFIGIVRRGVRFLRLRRQNVLAGVVS